MPAGGVIPSVSIAMENCQPGAHTRSLRREEQPVVRSQFCDNDVMPVSSLGREDRQSVARASVSVACRGLYPSMNMPARGLYLFVAARGLYLSDACLHLPKMTKC